LQIFYKRIPNQVYENIIPEISRRPSQIIIPDILCPVPNKTKIVSHYIAFKEFLNIKIKITEHGDNNNYKNNKS
jgi:hypothetical protein